MANRVGFSALVVGVAAVAVLLLTAQRSQALTPKILSDVSAPGVTSDRPAGYVVFPHVLVDASDAFSQGRAVDTVIQLTNTASVGTGCRLVQCIYVNTTNHCTISNDVCGDDSDCAPAGGTCGTTADCMQPETNFTLILSEQQAIGWSAANGNLQLPVDSECGGGTQKVFPVPGSALVGGPPKPKDFYFEGELKCFEITAAGLLLNSNDLKGEATIYETQAAVAGSPGTPGGIDVRAYNAIGFQATLNDGSGQSMRCVGGTDQGVACADSSACTGGGSCDLVACLGTSTAANVVCPSGISTGTYVGCPQVMILDHWFDGALNPVTSAPITTDLVLVPCSEDFGALLPPAATVAQFLIFNEFEQRFSTSTKLSCLEDRELSRIDAPAGQELKSVFNFNVQGTLTGQTRIRPVLGAELDRGHGLLGVAEEASGSTVLAPPSFTFGSAAFNLNYSGTITQPDTVKLQLPE